MCVREMDVLEVTAGLRFNVSSSSQLSSPSFFGACHCSPFLRSMILFLALSNANFLLVSQIELLGGRLWILLGSTGWEEWRPLLFPSSTDKRK